MPPEHLSPTAYFSLSPMEVLKEEHNSGYVEGEMVCLFVVASGFSFDGCQRALAMPNILFLFPGAGPCGSFSKKKIHHQYRLHICIFGIFAVCSL